MSGVADEPGQEAGHEAQVHDTVEAVVRSQLAKALGGRRGMVEAAVPTLVFTILWLTTRELNLALGVSVGSALVLLVARLVQRSSVQFCLNALFGIGLLLREKRFPGIARELGRISYSLYLVHPLVIHSVYPFHHGPVATNRDKLLTATVWIGGSVLVSMVTYRLIEKPCIDVGRKVSARWQARSRPPRAAAA